jgi:hypothetical protein
MPTAAKIHRNFTQESAPGIRQFRLANRPAGCWNAGTPVALMVELADTLL